MNSAPQLRHVRLADIAPGERHRKELGNVKELAESMKELGQLQPVGLNPQLNLIFGSRRLAAAHALGWPMIQAVVFDDFADAVLALKAERDENRCRKEMTPTEMVALGKRLEALEKPAAAERQRELGKSHGDPHGKFPEGGRGASRDKIGDALGVSGRTYEKAKQVADAAETHPEAFGDLPAKMDAASVDAAHKEYRSRRSAIPSEPVLRNEPESVPISPRTDKREQSMPAWTPTERERRDAVKRGETVVANLKADHRLIEWAQQEGIYVYIGRPGPWQNPYVIGEDGDRGTVLTSFGLYFARKHGLRKKLPELRGKVLGCYCHPEPCHGHQYLKLLAELDDEREEAPSTTRRRGRAKSAAD